MPGPEPFVDVHCHLLPAIDDGAADWDESLAMARLAVADGIGTIIATPHQLGNHEKTEGQTIRDRCAQLQQLLHERDVRLQVLPGADVRIDPELTRKIRSGQVLTLADHRRHVLLELPHELFLPLDRLLAELDASGIAGVLSHPERNRGILGRPRLVDPLVDAGCLMQVTAGSLVGTFGSAVQELAESLVANGLVHFVATDAHGSKARRPLMRRSYDRVVRLAGQQAALEMCCQNPARVARGQQVPAGRRKRKGRSLAGWLPWRKAG